MIGICSKSYETIIKIIYYYYYFTNIYFTLLGTNDKKKKKTKHLRTYLLISQLKFDKIIAVNMKRKITYTFLRRALKKQLGNLRKLYVSYFFLKYKNI